jgi:hypothetical protein
MTKGMRATFRTGLALVAVSLTICWTSGYALAQEDSLHIGYRLPSNPDLAADARTLESKCLNERLIANQACQSDQGCRSNAEIAFRRCVSGIQGAKFELARCQRNNCGHVDDFLELNANDAVNLTLNEVFGQIPSEGRYPSTGLYADLANGGCTIRRESDNGVVNFASSGDRGLEQRICSGTESGNPDGLQGWYNKGLYDAITQGDVGRVRALTETGYVVGCSAQGGLSVEDVKGYVEEFAEVAYYSDRHITLCLALDDAADSEQKGIVGFLLDRGAPNVEVALLEAVSSIYHGKAPAEHTVDSADAMLDVYASARFGANRLKTVQLLLDRGADPNPAVPVAVALDDVEILKLLLSHGASLKHAQRIIGDWPDLLTLAVAGTWPEPDPSIPRRCCASPTEAQNVASMVSFLISEGARPPSGPDDLGLMCLAAFRGASQAFRMVFNANADWSQACSLWTDTGNRLPLAVVVAAGNSAQVLEDFLGLPVSWSRKDLEQAVDVACHERSNIDCQHIKQLVQSKIHR